MKGSKKETMRDLSVLRNIHVVFILVSFRSVF